MRSHTRIGSVHMVRQARRSDCKGSTGIDGRLLYSKAVSLVRPCQGSECHEDVHQTVRRLTHRQQLTSDTRCTALESEVRVELLRYSPTEFSDFLCCEYVRFVTERSVLVF